MSVEGIPESIKKYGWSASLVLLLPFVLPYLEKYFDNKTASQTEAFVYEIKADLIKDIQAITDKQTRLAIESHAKTKLTGRQAVYLMKTAVGYQSIHKVNWLRRHMEKVPQESVYILEDSIKAAIKAEFIHQSNIYIDALNGFVHPNLGRLGDFVKEEFCMDRFLERVYGIVLNNDCGSCEIVMESVMYVMLDEQNQLWKKAEERIRR